MFDYHFLGPPHISPVTELSQLPGQSLSVHMRNFSPVKRDESCIVHDHPSLVNYCGFTNKINLHASEVEVPSRQKMIPFWSLCCESKAILSKMFHPG